MQYHLQLLNNPTPFARWDGGDYSGDPADQPFGAQLDRRGAKMTFMILCNNASFSRL